MLAVGRCDLNMDKNNRLYFIDQFFFILVALLSYIDLIHIFNLFNIKNLAQLKTKEGILNSHILKIVCRVKP